MGRTSARHKADLGTFPNNLRSLTTARSEHSCDDFKYDKEGDELLLHFSWKHWSSGLKQADCSRSRDGPDKAKEI
jgi:hypothetical protein